MSSATMTIRLSSDIKDGLGQLAAKTRRSRSFLAAEAIEAYVASETAIIEGIERGLADMANGQLVPHDEAMRRIESTIASAARRDP